LDEYVIRTPEQLALLWSKTYNASGVPDWSHILPYYDEQIVFKDSIQEIRGIGAFREMTERLAKRSNELYMAVKRTAMDGRVIFVEWEMTINYKKTRRSIVYGASRITLNEAGKIIEQRDYYDLWGDIFDNIPRFAKLYRKFMKDKFG